MPDKVLAQPMALRSRYGRQQHERPASGPVCAWLAIDSLGGLGKSIATVVRQLIFAELSYSPRLHPAFLGEAGSSGSDETLVDAKGNCEPDQAAEGHRAAARHDRISEYRHDQRSGAQRPLAPKAPDEIQSYGRRMGGHGSELYRY